MQEQHDRIATIFAANSDPLLDPADHHVFRFVDTIGGGDGIVRRVSIALEREKPVQLLRFRDIPLFRLRRGSLSEAQSGERGTEEQGQRVMEESSHCVVCELGCMLVQDQEVGAAAGSSPTPVSTVTILLNQRRNHCLDLSTKETRSI